MFCHMPTLNSTSYLPVMVTFVGVVIKMLKPLKSGSRKHFSCPFLCKKEMKWKKNAFSYSDFIPVILFVYLSLHNYFNFALEA